MAHKKDDDVEMSDLGGGVNGMDELEDAQSKRKRGMSRAGVRAANRIRARTLMQTRGNADVDDMVPDLDEVEITLQELETLLRTKIEQRQNMRQFFIFFCFIIVFMTQVFMARAVGQVYNAETAIKDVFIDEEFRPQDASFLRSFLDVKNMEEIWNWIEGPLVSQITVNEWYNGQTFTKEEEGYIYLYNRVVGGMRVRQLRVVDDGCTIAPNYRKLYPHCWPDYSSETVSKKAFGPGNKYKYKSPEETKIPTFVGRARSILYDGGGFVVDVDYNRSAIRSQFEELKRDRFIDKQTRALFITANFFNKNLNHFISMNTVREKENKERTGEERRVIEI
eukprot:TRINITY_DN1243_c0_g1_i8.p1 TRINITY_DN1243_c0_g1~~TRINITY_DN1243_c0_g1_i8.p1  ORF type:complete len:336 (-),score=109.88 TRINITY_DN1243_c0_g1_i8:26-1033(-)